MDKIILQNLVSIMDFSSCSPDEEEYAVEVESKVAEIDDYARSHGYEETDKRLQHWLDGSGTPLPLNVDSLTQTESVQKAIDTNHDRFISNNYFTSQIDPSRGTSILVSATSLEDGQSIPFHDKWDRVISYSDELRNGNIDLLGSVGNTQISSDGDFRITKNGNLYTVTGTVIHTIKDVYNFNPGDTFYIPSSSGGKISADDLNLLEKYRGAKGFDQNAEWTENVEAKGSFEDIQDPSNYKWSRP